MKLERDERCMKRVWICRQLTDIRFNCDVPTPPEIALTFHEAHGTIETFRTEFVVAETAQQLRHQDICLCRYLNLSHIAKQDLDLVVPFECFLFL